MSEVRVELFEIIAIDENAGVLHARQHLNQRKLQIRRQLPSALDAELRLDNRRDSADRHGRPADILFFVGGKCQRGLLARLRLAFVRVDGNAKIATDRLAHRISRRRTGLEKIGGDLGIAIKPVDFDAGAERGAKKRFGVVSDLLPARIFQAAGKPMHDVGKRQNARFTTGVAHGEPVFIPGQRDRLALAQLAFRGEFRDRTNFQRRRSRRAMEFNLFQTLVQAAKFEREKKIAHRFIVPRFETQLRRIEIYLNVIEQVAELFIDAHLLGVFCDRLAQLRRQLAGVSDHLFDVAVFIDQLRGGLVADAGHARQVIRGLALERDEIDPLLRRHAVALDHRRRIVTDHVGDAAARHDDGDAVAHQLKDIAIAGDQNYFATFFPRVLGQGRQQVVGFVAFQLDRGNAQASQHLADQRQLLLEQVGSRGSAGLVFLVAIESKLRRALIEANDDSLRPLVGQKFDQHRRKAVDGVGHLAGGRDESIGQSEKSAIRE